MTEEGTELEKVPLSKTFAKSDDAAHRSSMPEIVVLDEDSRPSTSGKSVPAINWGNKKVSPNDLEVRDARTAPQVFSEVPSLKCTTDCVLLKAMLVWSVMAPDAEPVL